MRVKSIASALSRCIKCAYFEAVHTFPSSPSAAVVVSSRRQMSVDRAASRQKDSLIPPIQQLSVYRTNPIGVVVVFDC